eukprot:3369020-Amphidinium_carterae.1
MTHLERVPKARWNACPTPVARFVRFLWQGCLHVAWVKDACSAGGSIWCRILRIRPEYAKIANAAFNSERTQANIRFSTLCSSSGCSYRIPRACHVPDPGVRIQMYCNIGIFAA